MKNRKKIILGGVFGMTMLFALWVQFQGKVNSEQFSADFLELNVKYGVIGMETLRGEKEMNELMTNLFQANIMAQKNNEKEVSKLLLKMKGEGLEGVMALSLKTDEDLEEVAADFSQVQEVEWAEPDREVNLTGWEEIAKEMIQEVELGKTEKGEKILVGLVDSGVDMDHPLLQGRVSEDGWDFVEEKLEMDDVVGHGTHVAGLILANSKSAEILPVKFTDGKTGSLIDLLKGMKFAVDQGVKVLNLSLGLNNDSPALREGVKFAVDQGVIVVAAAGNEGKEMKYFPAAWDEVLGVAALNQDGERFELSNWGDWVDFSAVGKDVLSAHPGKMWALRSGTSQAAPLVTAAVCEVMAELGDEELDEVREILNEVSDEGQEKLGRVIWEGEEVDQKLEAMKKADEVVASEIVNEGRGRVKFKSLW